MSVSELRQNCNFSHGVDHERMNGSLCGTFAGARGAVAGSAGGVGVAAGVASRLRVGALRTCMGVCGAATLREMHEVEMVIAPAIKTEGKSWQLAGAL